MITLKLGKYSSNQKELLLSSLVTAMEFSTNSETARGYSPKDRAKVVTDFSNAVAYLVDLLGE